jgi:hypothetical protein
LVGTFDIYATIHSLVGGFIKSLVHGLYLLK